MGTLKPQITVNIPVRECGILWKDRAPLIRSGNGYRVSGPHSPPQWQGQARPARAKWPRSCIYVNNKWCINAVTTPQTWRTVKCKNLVLNCVVEPSTDRVMKVNTGDLIVKPREINKKKKIVLWCIHWPECVWCQPSWLADSHRAQCVPGDGSFSGAPGSRRWWGGSYPVPPPWGALGHKYCCSRL